jgi:hypothetical protein
MHAFMTLQRKIDEQTLTGERRPRHLDPDAPQRISSGRPSVKMTLCRRRMSGCGKPRVNSVVRCCPSIKSPAASRTPFPACALK